MAADDLVTQFRWGPMMEIQMPCEDFISILNTVPVMTDVDPQVSNVILMMCLFLIFIFFRGR